MRPVFLLSIRLKVFLLSENKIIRMIWKPEPFPFKNAPEFRSVLLLISFMFFVFRKPFGNRFEKCLVFFSVKELRIR